MSKSKTFLVAIWFLPSVVFCQNDTLPAFIQQLSKFSLSGYGAMNYYHFDWQTDSVKRDAIDNERFIMELGYKWNDKIKLKAELEIEHGGVGADVEFDRFEEFGEFEFDITKGGEVLLEQMLLDFSLGKSLSLQAGRIKVPFGMMFKRDEPTDYLTALNSEAETMILPENWTENGLSLKGEFSSKFKFNLAIVNGLDNSAFNSANWIKRGNQRRFEMARAENFAIVARLDFDNNRGIATGFSWYGSNTTGNRPKPDLTVPVLLNIVDWHCQIKHKMLQINTLAFIGNLTNSEALTNQNRNLSNNLNVKRTPVGQAAIGAFAEVGLTFLGRNGIFKSPKSQTGILYTRFDYYDTMQSTQGTVFNNPRWERQTISAGAVFKVIDPVQIKLQYSARRVGAPAPTSIAGGTLETTVIAGFAFEF